MTEKQKLIVSNRRNPCPVCGRTKDGDCRISSDGLEVICHHPKDHRAGEVITGADDQTWAFTGNTRDGRAGHFTLDKPRDGAQRLPRRSIQRRPAEPARTPPAPLPEQPPVLARMAPREPAGSPYRYGPTQLVKRVALPDGDKAFYGFHLLDDKWEKGAGPDPWPVFNLADTIGADGWILEPEGEKCAELCAAEGVVSISQPGHAHTIEQIVPRYKALREAGCPGVVYLQDHDGPNRPEHQQEGRRRAENAAEAAAQAGLPMLVIPAIDLWPSIPDGGSIDDAPGGPESAILDIAEAAVEAYWTLKEPAQHPQPQPIEPPPLTLDEVREQFRYAVQGGASRQDLEAERIRLSDASSISASNLRDLFAAIQREEESGVQVAQEAQRLAKAITRADGNAGIRLDQIMPPLLADALTTRTRYLPSDDLSAVMAFLACVSGVVKLGTELVASNAAAYRVPLNLYVALVAKTGAKKSPLSKALVDEPTKALRAELAQQHSRAMAEWTEQNRGVKPAERPDPPAPVFISTSDYTAEALASQLQVHEIRKMPLSIHRDELAGLFGSFGRYTGGRGADSEQLLETFDGTGFRSLRVAAANGGRSYERCHLSIWGTIQPEILQGLVASGDASGLWARFGFVPLPLRAVRIADDETQAEIDATDAAAELLAAACRFLYCLPVTSLTLDGDARRLFMDYEFEAQEHALRATLPAYGALMGKAAGKVLRIAGLLHLLWSWELGSSPSAPVSIGVVDRAILLVDAINQWTVGIHESVAEAGEASDLMRMIHKLAEATQGPITWRDVAQRLTRAQRRDIDSGAAATAVEALAAMGMGTAGTGSRGAWTYQATECLP